MTRRYLLVFAVAFILGGTSYALRPVADASEPVETLILKSRVAHLESALYVAEGQACPNLGVHPVPPAKKARRK